MKNLTVVGVLMLGIGFAVGWISKPVPAIKEQAAIITAAAPVAVIRTDAPIPDAPVPGKRAQRDTAEKKAGAQLTPELMDQAKKMQSEMSKAMVKRNRAKLEKQIERLSENVDLSNSQKAGLDTWLDAQMKKLDNLDFSSGKPIENFPELAKSLTDKSLEEQLAPTLTNDQKSALAEFKDRDHRVKVDAMALKSLSKLQGAIDFEEGQRDKVYEVLVSNAEASRLAEEENPDMTAMLTEGMGVEMDPYDLGLQQALTEAASKMSGDNPDQKDMWKNLRVIFDQRVDAKVEQLRPVLHEKQLDQYRAELKSKGMGVYGPMMTRTENK